MLFDRNQYNESADIDMSGAPSQNAAGRLGTGALPGGDGKPPRKKRKPGPIKRVVNGWWDRLLGAVSAEGGLADQEAEYESHQTKQDFLWNSIGFGAWGMVFPLLTIVVTQVSGVEQAGMFSLAFVTANLLYIMANYGARTYQVSDIDERHSFSDYQFNRVLTCLAMLLVGYAYCTVRGYDGLMFGMSIAIYAYKAIDAMGDVYEGRLQQTDKLYLAGISQTIRSVAVFVAFCLVLLVSHNLVAASIAGAVAAGVSLVVVTFPLALLETPKSRHMSFGSVGELFKRCFPVFVALFLYAFIDNMPKFMMEGMLTYDNQLYFNALYFPAQAILIVVGLIYKPLLVRMANAWANVEARRKFDLFILVIMAMIVGITVVGILLMNWIGIPIMSFMYGVDFEQFRSLALIMMVAGGITGGIDFLYQVITVLRRQKVVTSLYLITFLFAIVIPWMMIQMFELRGAVVAYGIVMGVLFVLLLWQYIGLRIEYTRHPDADPALSLPAADAAAAEERVAPSSPSASVPMRPVATPRPRRPQIEDVRHTGTRRSVSPRSRRDSSSGRGRHDR